MHCPSEIKTQWCILDFYMLSLAILPPSTPVGSQGGAVKGWGNLKGLKMS